MILLAFTGSEVLLALHGAFEIVGIPDPDLLIVAVKTACVEASIGVVCKPLSGFLTTLELTLNVELAVLMPSLIQSLIQPCLECI